MLCFIATVPNTHQSHGHSFPGTHRQAIALAHLRQASTNYSAITANASSCKAACGCCDFESENEAAALLTVYKFCEALAQQTSRISMSTGIPRARCCVHAACKETHISSSSIPRMMLLLSVLEFKSSLNCMEFFIGLLLFSCCV